MFKPALYPLGALLLALFLFGMLAWTGGRAPIAVWSTLFQGAFGDEFAWENTLQRAAPMMLTALCVALPARAGMIIIGGEGAMVLGALASATAGAYWGLPANLVGIILLCLTGALTGALWIMLAGALRQWRGVNETISSLLLVYIATGSFRHLSEGILRDPGSVNKPATPTLDDALMIGTIGNTEVHWGFVMGLLACIGLAVWLRYSTTGFALKVTGGNQRTARLMGLPVTPIALVACALGGASAGLGGAVEVAAVHGNANAALIAGYGYTGILVSFMARHHLVSIIPVALLLGGFGAAGSLLQRRLGMPDASIAVLQGITFLMILAAEGLRHTDWHPLKNQLKTKLCKSCGPRKERADA